MMIKKYNQADLDIDVSALTREDILNKLKHVPASKINSFGIYPHNVGVYFCDIPQDRITELASIDYKSAEEDFGFFKIDLLHTSGYDLFKNRDEMFDILNDDIDWTMLKNKLIVNELPHINNYFDLLQKWNPQSIEELAMFLAVIRPNKKKYINIYDYNKLKDVIWIKEESQGYFFKKSHAIAYALYITLIMRKLKRQLI